jgi:hypothetical protein
MSRRFDYYEAICRACGRHSRSVAEFLVLGAVRMKVPLAPMPMAFFLVKEFSHRDELQCSYSAFEAAIETCLRDRLLRLLTKSDLRLPLPHWSAFADSTVPLPVPGVLDLTQRGRDLEQRMADDFMRYRAGREPKSAT